MTKPKNDNDALTSILLVDENTAFAHEIRSSLPSKFHVDILENGQDAIEYISRKIPDVVLLDVSEPELSLLEVSLPGLSGYETCKTIRNDLGINELPIFFLSDKVKEKDRLKAYEFGADDFLPKSISAFELQYKIEIILKLQAERQQLKEEIANSYATAMTALSTAGEVGIVLNFLRASFKCQNYLEICQQIINSLSAYDLDGIVQIRGAKGISSLSSDGVCSPFEESILNHMFGHDRVFEFSACISCSYKHITIIIKNLALDDPERMGRIKDTLALLTEGANERIISLDNEYELIDKHEALSELAFETTVSLENIKRQHNIQRDRSEQILNDLQSNFDMRLMTLGLTESQESELTELINDSIQRFLALHDETFLIETCITVLLDQLQNLVKK